MPLYFRRLAAEGYSMKISLKILILSTLILLVKDGFSRQIDSCHLKISLLTCSPGQELYSIFGHSALRVSDSQAGTDIIFNYGSFDFSDPDFYSKFVRGKLLYYVSAEYFQDFVFAYRYEGRGIIEQHLNLSCETKSILYQALRENLREENKYYLYDFLFDNCSTRLRDMVRREGGDSLYIGKILPAEINTSFRNLIHEYLHRGGQYWSKLGIDLLLGARIDRAMANEEAMFLPDYLMKGFDSALIDGRQLVAGKRQIQPEMLKPAEQVNSPLIITGSLFLIISILSFSTKPAAKRLLYYFDVFLFLLSGLIGLLLLYMWFGTDHRVCADNYNILWAFPLNIYFAVKVGRKNIREAKLFTALFCGYLLIASAWFFLPQQMNLAFFPLTLTIAARALANSFLLNKTYEKTN